MKKIIMILITLMITVAVFATPRLEGNKIYLNEAATSKFTAEQFIANIGGEEALDIVDEAGHTKRMQLELFCNPNKVIEFETEEMAAFWYNSFIEANLQPEDLYIQDLDHYENLDFFLFMTLFDTGYYTHNNRDGKKVITGVKEKATSTHIYISSSDL